MSNQVTERNLEIERGIISNGGEYTLVVGLGATGFSCVENLLRRGVHVVVTDSRREPPYLESLKNKYPEVSFQLGGFDPQLFSNANEVIISPGIAVSNVAVENAILAGRPVYGDIELFAQQAQAPVIAITGSNGKSTVTTLVFELLKAAGRRVEVGGNLGPSALNLLTRDVPEFYVLELSSFQLETTNSLNAAAAVVLNLSSDHMDRYETLAQYSSAKQRIFRGDGVMVVNQDDTAVLEMLDHGRRAIGFSLDAESDATYSVVLCKGEDWIARDKEPLMPVSRLGLCGRHNVSNVLAALALVEAVDVETTSDLDVLIQFRGLPHRCELIREKDNVRWVNDSKATNVGASIAAVEGLFATGPIVLIAGGQSKGADFTQLGKILRSFTHDLILIGRDGHLIGEAVGTSHSVHYARSMAHAITIAHQVATAGSTVLFSPACASFDMYNNYAERGEDFSRLVWELQ